MCRHRMLGAVALLGLLGILACEGSSPSSPSAVEATRSVAQVDLGADIRALIDAGFPKGFSTVINTMWDQTLRSLAKDPKVTLKGRTVPGSGGRAELVRTVDFIQKKSAEATPPVGETQAHFVARLVLYMSLYVYDGPAAQPPSLALTSDVAFKLVQPTVTDTVVTTAKKAAAIFPAGAVSEPTVVVVTPITTNYPDNCSGPLDTKLCQYPLFYTFNVFPDVKLNVAAKVQVCHVDRGANRTPLAPDIHDGFRIAHDAPASLADKSAGSTLVDGIEQLALVAMNVTTCAAGDGTTYPSVAMAAGHTDMGTLRLAATVAMHRMVAAVRRTLAPREAYAIDVGGGGSVELFSNFGVVDPNGVADPAQSTGSTGSPGTPFSVISPATLSAGGSVTVPAWTVTNAGTAKSGAFTSSVVLSPAADLSAPLVTIAAVGATTPLAPRALRSYGATAVTIPAGLAPGTYYVGTVISTSGPDAVTANNKVSKAVVVSSTGAGSISGRVENAFTHAALSAATVTAGNRSAISNSDGMFLIADVPAGTVSVTAAAPGYVSATRSGVVVSSASTTAIGTLALAPVASTSDIRIVLDWGACSANNPAGPAPCDLDSHLSGPTAGTSRFHVYYGFRSFSDAASTATLDIDRTQGLGPETVTISKQSAGTYRYYVHDYSQWCCGGPAITASSAHVRVFSGASQVAEYFVPTTGTGNGWKVFSLSGGVITPENTIIDMSPSTVLQSRMAPGALSAASNALDTDLDKIIQDIVNSPKTAASPSVSPFRKP